MDGFTREELDKVDRLWRRLPNDHVWTGWAAAGETPDEILIIRTRAHWRRFPLRKHHKGFALHDERGAIVEIGSTLETLLARVEALPALQTGAGSKGDAGDQPPSGAAED